MSDQDILDRIDQNLLRVDPETRQVWTFDRNKKRWFEKVPDLHPISGRSRIQFNNGKANRKIGLHRLVWLWVHRRPLPDVVDHRDGDRHNDAPDNLGEHGRLESDRQGNEVQLDRSLRRLCDWFEHIAVYGAPPETDPWLPP